MNSADQSRIARAFGHAAPTYDAVADLQLESLRGMVAQLVDEDRLRAGDCWLDLGSGTGAGMMELARVMPGLDIVSMDLSREMLCFQRKRCHEHPGSRCWIQADAAQLPLAPDSVHGVFSNMMLQWCDAPGQVLAECFRVLRHQGHLALTTFGPATLCELAHAWQAVDDRRHVNDFVSPDEILRCAEKAGFEHIAVSTRSLRRTYTSVEHLMRSLKHLGARTVTGGNRGNYLLTPGRFLRLKDAYAQQMAHDGQTQATYEIIMVKAAKMTGYR